MERAKDANIVGILVGTLGVGMFHRQLFFLAYLLLSNTSMYPNLYCHTRLIKHEFEFLKSFSLLSTNYSEKSI